jgi:hypothetical protein
MASGGFNVVDFMDLPPLERGIVRLVLRDITLSHTRLLQVVTHERNIDAASVEDALDHLTLMQWLICQGSGQNKFYRVNTRQKIGSTNAQCIWDDLDLDGIKMPGTPQISMGGADTAVAAPESALTAKSGGKRHLPQQIWDRLDSSAKDAPNDSSTQAAKPVRSSLFDKLGDDGSSSKTQ